MRIISGQYKGIRIALGKELKARPTTDFAKEGLFNVLDNIIDIEDKTVLELFSGSGSIAFEFVSRYAKSVIGVEMSAGNIKFIKQTIDKLKINNYTILKGDVFKFIPSCLNQFDIIFADPPYALKNLQDIPSLIFENNLLQDGGILILEHGKDHQFTDHAHFVEERKYGNVHFSIFRKN